VTYFFDNNISPDLVKILRLLGVNGVALRERFSPETPDEDYLSFVAQQGWVLVTCDLRIRTRPPEAAALKRAGIRAVFIGNFFPNLSIWEQALWLVKNWRQIDGIVATRRPGTICSVKRRGRIDTS